MSPCLTPRRAESDDQRTLPAGRFSMDPERPASNGENLLSTSDTRGRVGELPVTFVARADGLIVWEAPSDWVDAGR